MTKVRPALTFENALTQIAGHIGWTETAKICGRAENTVRNWSDSDTQTGISLEAALKLDVAFHEAGGEGAPFLLCYATRVDAERLAATPERQALIASAARSAKESGEAVSAILTAAGASARIGDFAIAERELEESITAQTHALAALRARKKAFLEVEGDEEREPARAQGVPPPPVLA